MVEEDGLMFVELDVHRRVCYETIIDEGGKIVKQDRISSDPDYKEKR